jgi:hypothetical protein
VIRRNAYITATTETAGIDSTQVAEKGEIGRRRFKLVLASCFDLSSARSNSASPRIPTVGAF